MSAVLALNDSTAKRRLAAVDMSLKVTRRSYSKAVRRGHVISQYPPARSHARLLKKQRPVMKLVLSRGKRAKRKPPEQAPLQPYGCFSALLCELVGRGQDLHPGARAYLPPCCRRRSSLASRSFWML